MSAFEIKADRQKNSDEIKASRVLEGYEPQKESDGLVYILQKKWIDGKITLEERKQKLL
jgi:hypothetical protein